MNSSQSIASLAAALVKAQAKIEGATKDKTNPHFKSKYADLSSVVEAIKKPATDNGLTWTQVMHDAENAARCETIIIHNSGEWLSCGVISVPVSKQDAQGYGSALTYARRYSLSAAFGVAPEDDDGNAASAAAPRLAVTPTAGAKDNISPEQRVKVDKIVSAVTDWLNSGSVADAVLTKENAGLDADETVYFWTKFDSKQRAAMKREFQVMKLENAAKNGMSVENQI
jgi:hypothetical protein